MKTRLDRLLERIDPDKTFDSVSKRVDNALNSFQLRSGVVDDWNTFLSIIGKFYRHTENAILGIPSFQTKYSGIDRGRAERCLNKEYGSSGSKAAFEIVRTGVRGGIYSILKIIATHMVEEYAGNEISARIIDFWNGLSFDEKESAIDEYLSKHGHLLPSELTEGSAVRIKVNFVNVLKEHPRMIKRVRNLRYV